MPGTIVRCQEMEIQREKYREYFFFLSLCVGSELLRELLSELLSELLRKNIYMSHIYIYIHTHIYMVFSFFWPVFCFYFLFPSHVIHSPLISL